ncbi:MAG: hypothetical protein HY074_00085 [Deltaproteobacteria bacterium]|nr:hypothetical protein [Deltaproteobacteria bacterium]
MLTPDLLQQRLKDWTAEFSSASRATAPSPIDLYQRTFGLIHTLKASIQLSEDTAIQGLHDTALGSDEILVKLAYGEFELAPSANANLHKLVAALDALEPLEVFLKTALPAAVSLREASVPLLELPFAWDALSRARARSCTKHGYRFFQRQDSITLASLPSVDAATNREIGSLGGIVVVRKLDPGQAVGTDLMLSSNVIVAIPSGSAAPAPPWQPVRL